MLVVGEALVDIVDVRGGSPREHVGGSPANVALGLGRLGVDVRLHTALAHDAYGNLVARHLQSSGVIIDHASWTLAQTCTARALIDYDGSAMYDFEVDWQLPIQPAWCGEKVVHVGSIGAFLAPGAQQVADLVRQVSGNALLTFDPNIRPALMGDRTQAIETFENIASHATLVKLSDDDAAWLYPGDSLEHIMQRISILGAKCVAITLGSAGATGCAGAERVEMPAPAVKVDDTIGAGDTFMATLIDGLVERAPELNLAHERTLRRLMLAAVAAASITVQRHGADLPTRREVQRAAHRYALQLANRSYPPTYIS